jgi:hypothetical protein
MNEEELRDETSRKLNEIERLIKVKVTTQVVIEP